jgi:hypothetical protein
MPSVESPLVLYVVVDLAPGFAREDAHTPTVIAAVRSKQTAQRISALSGPSAVVQEVEVGAVPPGMVSRARELLGVELRDSEN